MANVFSEKPLPGPAVGPCLSLRALARSSPSDAGLKTFQVFDIKAHPNKSHHWAKINSYCWIQQKRRGMFWTHIYWSEVHLALCIIYIDDDSYQISGFWGGGTCVTLNYYVRRKHQRCGEDKKLELSVGYLLQSATMCYGHFVWGHYPPARFCEDTHGMDERLPKSTLQYTYFKYLKWTKVPTRKPSTPKCSNVCTMCLSHCR